MPAYVEEPPILIAGGGIGGLAAALALSRKGHRVHVVEKAEAFREIGAGIQMPPNAFAAFAALGILETIQEVAAYPEELAFGDLQSGEILYRAPIDEAFVERFGYPYALLHRGDVLERLLAACRASDLVTLTSGERITSFRDDGMTVGVATASGKIYEGRGLVACDGLWSLGREILVDDGLPRTDGYVLCRGVVPVSELPQDAYSRSVTMWGGDGLDFFHYPLRRQEIFNIGASFHCAGLEAGPASPVVTRDALNRHFRHACPHVKTLLAFIDTSRSWALHDREPVRTWSKGLVTLLGDAAHPTNVYVSQGACMALEDAVVLAECVTGASSVAEGFKAYEAERVLRTARIQFTSREFGRLYHADGVMRQLRNSLLPTLPPATLSDTLAWMWKDPFRPHAERAEASW